MRVAQFAALVPLTLLGPLSRCDGPPDTKLDKPQNFFVEVRVNPRPGGTVTSIPAGMQCPGPCTASFDTWTPTLVATANRGFRFAGWGGHGLDGITFFRVKIDSASKEGGWPIYAYFEPLPGTLSVDIIEGQGSVTSVPAGITCPSECSHSFPQGQTVLLKAAPAHDYNFLGWTGACSGPLLLCTVSVQGAKGVGVTFRHLPATLAVTIDPSGSGSVTSTGGEITCPTTCSARLPFGNAIILVAQATAGWAFSGWGGACATERSVQCTVTMGGDGSATARFVSTAPPPPPPDDEDEGGGQPHP